MTQYRFRCSGPLYGKLDSEFGCLYPSGKETLYQIVKPPTNVGVCINFNALGLVNENSSHC